MNVNYVAAQLTATNNIFRDWEESQEHISIDLSTVDLTEFLTAGIYAQMTFYQRVTGEDIDIIDWLGIATRLIFQDAKPESDKE